MTSNDLDRTKRAFAYLEKYRTAELLLQVQPVSVTELMGEDCLVILDTNSLLVPFSTTPKSWESIRDELQKLSDSGRLRIPRHVVREFVENRVRRLKDLYSSLQNVVGHVSPIEIPFLEANRAYKKAQEAHKAAETAVAAYRKAAGEVRDVVRNLRWNDPVSSFLASLPPTTYFEYELGSSYQLDLERAIARRKDLDIGPGLKDSNKEVNSAGDYLIWISILALGGATKRHALFVTSELKNDWWHESGNTPLYPRFELVAEYWDATEGRTIHIVTLNQLLDSLKVDRKIVKEVTTIEELSRSGTSRNRLGPKMSHRSAAERLLRVAAKARRRPPRILPTPEHERSNRDTALRLLGYHPVEDAYNEMIRDEEFPRWLKQYHGRDRVTGRALYRDDPLGRFAEYVALKRGGMDGLRDMYIACGRSVDQATTLAARVLDEVHLPFVLEQGLSGIDTPGAEE